MIRRLLALIFTVLVLFAVPASAEDSEQLTDIRELPFSIEFVQIAAPWRFGEQEGYYRVIVTTLYGTDHAYSNLFIQWIENAEDDKSVRTIEVKELGSLVGIVPKLKIFPTGNLRIKLLITHHDGKHERHTITARPDGHYTFK